MDDVSAREIAAMAQVDGESNPLDDSMLGNPITLEEREPFERVARLNRLIAGGHHRTDPIRPDILEMVESHRRARLVAEKKSHRGFWSGMGRIFTGPTPAFAMFVFGAVLTLLMVESKQLEALLPGEEAGVAERGTDVGLPFSRDRIQTDERRVYRPTASRTETKVPSWVSAYVREHPDSDVARIFPSSKSAAGSGPESIPSVEDALGSLAEDGSRAGLFQLPNGDVVMPVGEDTDGCVIYRTAKRETMVEPGSSGPFQQEPSSSAAVPGFFGAFHNGSFNKAERFCPDSAGASAAQRR